MLSEEQTLLYLSKILGELESILEQNGGSVTSAQVHDEFFRIVKVAELERKSGNELY